MPLPILQVTHQPGPADLVRLFHKTEAHWTAHLAEPTPLDVGTAYANPDLAAVWDANRVLDAALPDSVTPAEAVAEAEEHFRQAGTRCAAWVLNPAAPAGRTAPLAEHLSATGWRPSPDDILYLAGHPAGPIREAVGLTIIPARASFRHARMLAEEAAARWDRPQVADADMLHLDDPHWDALIALRDGTPAGGVGVLAVGEVGRIANVFVSERFRRQGVGRTLMGRALEICARSLFKHVLLSAEPGDTPAQALYRELGFRKIGEIVNYRRSATA